MRIRCFIAVELDDAIKDELRKIQHELRLAPLQGARIKWVESSQIHLTIKFIGEIEDGLIEEVNALIVKSTTDIPPFEIRISGLSAFPNLNRPRVIVVGVQDETAFLGQLFGELDQNLVSIGIESERRGFRPHLTLGRTKMSRKRGANSPGGKETTAARSLGAALRESADVDLGMMSVSEIVLFRSQLTPGGPIYTALSRTPLDKG